MAEDIMQPTPEGQQSFQVLLDESGLKTTYSNAYRLHQSMEEVIVDLGFNMMNPSQQSGQAQMLFKVTERVVMTYSNAKRLSMSLQQLIKRYEQQFGEIPVGQGQRR